MKLQISLKEGKVEIGRKDLEKLLKHSPDGFYILSFQNVTKPRTIKECYKYYFYLCDTVAKEGDTGYTSKNIHNLFKTQVMPKIPNLQDNINGSILEFLNYSTDENGGVVKSINFTTKMLNLNSWISYIDLCKQYIKENFNIYV